MYITKLCNTQSLFQYLATFSGSISVISSGINLGWTSPYLPQLLDSPEIPTTSDQGSWCAVMPLVGAPVGAIGAAILADRIGRKWTTLATSPIVFCCFIWLAFAKTILLISILRFVIGATEGALYTVLPMYIGEISDPGRRGFLAAIPAIAGIIGTLFINIVGQSYSIYWSSLMCALVPLAHSITFVWMPETPYYFIKKHEYDLAQSSLKLLRGVDDVTNEFESLCKAVARQEKTPKANFLDLVRVPSNRKACLIFVIISTTKSFSGKNPTLSYTAAIFQEAGSSISTNLSVIVYCTVELLATLATILIVDRFGKRLLLIISTTGCGISVFFLTIFFYLRQHFPDYAEMLDWLPITSLAAYNILYSAGLAFAAVSILSELFPTNIKALALCTADTYSITMGTVALKIFQITNDRFSMFVPFAIFSTCCFIGLIFIVKFVPETKGKSLEDIQRFLIGDSRTECFSSDCIKQSSLQVT